MFQFPSKPLPSSSPCSLDRYQLVKQNTVVVRSNIHVCSSVDHTACVRGCHVTIERILQLLSSEPATYVCAHNLHVLTCPHTLAHTHTLKLTSVSGHVCVHVHKHTRTCTHTPHTPDVDSDVK